MSQNGRRQSRTCVFYSFPQLKETLPMQSSAHHSALQAKHATLDQRLAEETHRPLPNSALIAELKKQKLKLKEEMTS
jgi:hypothetical protein